MIKKLICLCIIITLGLTGCVNQNNNDLQAEIERLQNENKLLKEEYDSSAMNNATNNSTEILPLTDNIMNETPTPTPVFDFRNTRWGDTHEVVKLSENANSSDRNEFSPKNSLIYNGKLAEFDAEIEYRFDTKSNSLIYADYSLSPQELSNYNTIKNALMDEYHEPIQDEIISAQVYGEEYQEYITIWKTNRTEIILSMLLYKDDYSFSKTEGYPIYIKYLSRSVFDSFKDNILFTDFIYGGGSGGYGELVINYFNDDGKIESFTPSNHGIVMNYSFDDINSDNTREIVNFENILSGMFDSSHGNSAAFPVIYMIDTANKQLIDISAKNTDWYKNIFMPDLREKITKSENEYSKYAYIALYILVSDFVKGNLPNVYLDSDSWINSEDGKAIATYPTAYEYYRELLIESNCKCQALFSGLW